MSHQWLTQAVCRTDNKNNPDADPDNLVDPDDFHPGGNRRRVAEATARAKEACRRCPVIAECRADPYTQRSTGIVAGLTFDERRERDGLPRWQAADYDECGCGQEKRRHSVMCGDCRVMARRQEMSNA